MAVNNFGYNNPYGYTGNFIGGYNNYAGGQMNNQFAQQNNQVNQSGNYGNLMAIPVTTEEEVKEYPVAAGVTVLLISFNLGKFWLKSTNTSGIPEPLRIFPFHEEGVSVVTTPQSQIQIETQTQSQQPVKSEPEVSREEFLALAESVKKLINDLGGDSNE